MAREFEIVDLEAWSYTLTEDDVEDGCNRLGMRVTAPLNVPLCKGCDAPLDEYTCPNCELVFVTVEERPDGWLRVAA